MAEKVSREASEAYFRSRPVSSQLGALASEQSAVIPSRAWLENRYRDLERQYAASDIPVPLHWGGFRVLPAEMEFWQGRETGSMTGSGTPGMVSAGKPTGSPLNQVSKSRLNFCFSRASVGFFLTISSSFSPSV